MAIVTKLMFGKRVASEISAQDFPAIIYSMGLDAFDVSDQSGDLVTGYFVMGVRLDEVQIPTIAADPDIYVMDEGRIAQGDVTQAAAWLEAKGVTKSTFDADFGKFRWHKDYKNLSALGPLIRVRLPND